MPCQHRIIIIMAALLSAIAFVISKQTNEIHDTLDDAAYQNMETMMQTISSTVNSTFIADHTYMQSMASTVSLADDMQKWLETVDYDSSKVMNLYYSSPGGDTAYGKNGKTLDLSDYVFTEHRNGQVRSSAYMTDIGNYAYLMRQPILKDGETAGFFYGGFLMRRFYTFLPRNVTDINDISLLEASTMTYIHIP